MEIPVLWGWKSPFCGDGNPRSVGIGGTVYQLSHFIGMISTTWLY